MLELSGPLENYPHPAARVLRRVLERAGRCTAPSFVNRRANATQGSDRGEQRGSGQVTAVE